MSDNSRIDSALIHCPPTEACSCCWSLEMDAAGQARSVRMVGWQCQHSPESYRSALHAVSRLQTLQTLELCRYPSRVLPACIQRLSYSLTTLAIDGAQQLRDLPEELGHLSSLLDLTIKDCPRLQAFPVQVTQLAHLERLSIEGCYGIRSVPNEIGRLCGSLRHLTFRDFGISCLPNEICQLSKLDYLELADFGVDFKLLPAELGSCRELHTIYLGLEFLTALPSSLGELQELEELITHGCCSLEAIPKEIKHCKKLRSLWLYDTGPDAVVEFFNEPWNPRRYAAAPVYVSLQECLLGPFYREVLAGLPSSLLELNLAGNAIDNLQDAVDVGLPEGIRALALQENPAIETDECRGQLKTLLLQHPHLGRIGHNEHGQGGNRCMTKRLIDQGVFHMMIMNQSGRILLENKGKKRLPLSLWPLAMERVHKIVDGQVQAYQEKDQFHPGEHIASAIFAMLQEGPALLDATNERLPQTSPRRSTNKRKRRCEELTPLLDAVSQPCHSSYNKDLLSTRSVAKRLFSPKLF